MVCGMRVQSIATRHQDGAFWSRLRSHRRGVFGVATLLGDTVNAGTQAGAYISLLCFTRGRIMSIYSSLLHQYLEFV